jgi:glycosyltransferase involved in cell wall biosynthesis
MMHSSMTGTGTIAFVSNNCWSLFNFRKPLLDHFLSQGYRVIAIAAEDEYSREIEAIGCIYYPIEFRNSTISPLRDIRLFFDLRSIYRKEMPGIIFHYVTKPCIFGSFAAGALNIPSVSVITGLGYVFSGNKWIRHPVRFLLRKALVYAHQVWFLNPENAVYFSKNNIIPQEKARVIPGEGIDTHWFSPRPGNPSVHPFIFLMVSRLLWSKGLGIYVEAARILRRRHISAEFRLLGKPEAGHPESVAQEQLVAWQKEGILVNLGFTNDVRTELSQADCLVLPTYYEEGIPRTLLEASSMEIPCITTDHTGSHTVISDGENGLLCKPKDAEDLASKMTAITLMKEDDRKEMGRKGRQKMIREFDIIKVRAIYEQIINHYLPR